MINIVINNDCVAFPHSWSELTLDKALALRSYLEELNLSVQMSDNELFCFLVEGDYLDEIIALITNNYVKCNSFFRLLWDSSLKSFVLGLLGNVDYVIENIKDFKFGGCQYSLPDFNSITAEKLCLLNTLYLQNPLQNANKICAVLCSQDDEFNEITMDLVFEIFNFICELNNRLKSLFPDCYKRIVLDVNTVKNSLDWHQLLIFAAAAIPSEVEFLRKQHCTDFMQLLDYKFKQN